MVEVCGKSHLGVRFFKCVNVCRENRLFREVGNMGGRGCTGQMHNLRRTFEQRWSFQQATVMSFVDFASAFDSVYRDSLWWIMAVDGMPPKL